jgi:predicted ArsR family transcriptional regulator
MSALQLLMQRGEMTAQQIADALGIEIERAYMELVRLDAAELVRVNVRYRGLKIYNTWEAMNEAAHIA